jgi:hypothetical protein
MALTKCDNFFQQIEVDVHFDKNMGNVKDHWKILEPPNKSKKDNKKDFICGHCITNQIVPKSVAIGI